MHEEAVYLKGVSFSVWKKKKSKMVLKESDKEERGVNIVLPVYKCCLHGPQFSHLLNGHGS